MNRSSKYGADGRLKKLSEIRKIRLKKLSNDLNAKKDLEALRSEAVEKSQLELQEVEQKLDGYVLSRFENAKEIENFGRFVASVTLGHFHLRRNAARAGLVVDRMVKMSAEATEDRQKASTDYMRMKQRADAIDQVLQEQVRTGNRYQEMMAEDIAAELKPKDPKK